MQPPDTKWEDSFPGSSGRPAIPLRSRAARRCTASIAAAVTAPTCAAATWADRTCCGRRSRLSDQDGELIVPIIQGSRQRCGMPAIQMSPEDAKAVAAYVRSVLETIGGQGMPPSIGQEPPSMLVGNAERRQGVLRREMRQLPFRRPAICKGIATRISDPKMLQNTWVAGGGRGGRGGRGGARRRPPVRRHSRRHPAVGRDGGRPAGPHRRLPGHAGTGRRNACAPSAATATCRRSRSTTR